MIALLDSHTRCRATVSATLAALVLAVGLAGQAIGSDFLATDDFHDVEEVVTAYVQRFGAEHVLLAVDIDNTLLAMNHDLGSDQWFEWQSFLLEHEPDSPQLVADSFDGLLEVQAVLYMLGRMHPPQPEQPTIVGRLQGMGISTLVLTSRGDTYRVATERELARNGYDLARSALAVRDQPGGKYLPYDLSDPAAAGLKSAEVERFELKQPKPVSYAGGVMMVSGQHKGAMLLTMLARAQRDIRAVVFVDDHGRHVGRVYAALTARDMEVTVLHYYHQDDRVAAFQYSDKTEVTRQWRRLKDVIDSVFEGETSSE